MRLSQLFTILVLLTVTACTAAFMLRDHLLFNLIERKLERLSQQVGEDITVESATLQGLHRISLRGLQVGNDRLIHIQRIDVTLDKDSLLTNLLQGSRPKVSWSYIMQPTIIANGRSLKEIANRQHRRFEQMFRRFKSSKMGVKSSSGSGSIQQQTTNRLSQFPSLEISGAKISGRQGLLFIHKGTLSLREGLIRATWRGEAPNTGYCTAEGQLSYAKISCHDHFKLPLGHRFEVAGRQVEWKGGKAPSISLKGLYLTQLIASTKSKANLPFSKVKLDIVGGLTPNSEGQFPIETAIVFPGGGRLIASGFASPQEMKLSTQVSGFPMHTLADGQSGTLNADAQIWTRWADGAATFEGKLSLMNAVIRHHKLAEGPVGPLNLSTDGVLRLAWIPQAPSRFKLSVENANAQIGDINGRLSGTWNQFQSKPHLTAEFEVPQIKAKHFAASIPNGLMPNLQPITLAGRLGFNGRIDLNFAQLDKTVLKFRPRLRRLKVLSFNQEIDFQALKGSFDTRFEMPNGDIYSRVSGPETERWVELNEMPPLLPKSVISQEDGGFYKHGGISLFHLRGSLVRNLKEGRFVRGGSTLTMQLIKNLYLHRKKTLSRKLEEVCLAWLIEKKLSKDELITVYLNIVEFGPNLFGIKEAAKHYFNKAPIDLIPEEISAITRLLPGPRLYAKFFERKRFSRAYTNRVNRLLKLLVKKKYLSNDEWTKITSTSLWERKAEVNSPSFENTDSPTLHELKESPATDLDKKDLLTPRPQEIFEPF